MSSLHDPTTDELRSVLDDMVGRPHPSPDLAEGARRRGTALRRQRLSVVSAGVAAVAVLVVPSTIAVRHDLNAGVGSGGKGAPAVSKQAAPSKKADTGQHEGTREEKLRSAGVSLPPPGTAATVDSYTVDESKALTAVDTSRVAAAQHLLGSAFTKTDEGATIDARTGAVVGTSATFRTASGESVGVVWAKVDPADKGATSSSASSGGTGGLRSSGSGATSPTKDSLSTLGASAIRNGIQIGVKAVQPATGTPVLTMDQVNHLLDGLLAAES